MVKILAVDHKAKVNVQDKTKQTPCHIAAYNGDLDIVECLVENGADLKLKDEDGVTILEYAQEEGHKDIVPPGNPINFNFKKSIRAMSNYLFFKARL